MASCSNRGHSYTHTTATVSAAAQRHSQNHSSCHGLLSQLVAQNLRHDQCPDLCFGGSAPPPQWSTTTTTTTHTERLESLRRGCPLVGVGGPRICALSGCQHMLRVTLASLPNLKVLQQEVQAPVAVPGQHNEHSPLLAAAP
jgi:hypothetical protein